MNEMAIDIVVYPYLNPRIVEVLDSSTDATVQEVVDAVRAWEDSDIGQHYPPLITAAGKEALGGGVTVGITATLLNTRLMFTARTAPLEGPGTCTTSDTTGTVLHATGGDFVNNGIYQGCTAYNYTTGSMAAVTEVISAIELHCFQITGGSSTEWTSGDSYYVYPNVQCNLTGGNIVAVDENGDEIPPVMQSPNVQVVRSSSSSATLQELEAIQYSSYQNAVWVNPNTSNYGVAYPVGTREYPVNNLSDAILIAAAKGFSILQVLVDMTLDSGTDFSGFEVIGHNRANTTITIAPSAVCENITIRNCSVTGTLDGGTVIVDCNVTDLNYVHGELHDCSLNGTILLGGSDVAQIINCNSGIPGTGTPTINMGGSGQGLSLRNYNGGIELANKSGSENVSLDINSGQIILDSTITNGTIVCRGIGKLTDSSVGATVVNEMINLENIPDAVWSEVLP
jgi:hypothetical protein